MDCIQLSLCEGQQSKTQSKTQSYTLVEDTVLDTVQDISRRYSPRHSHRQHAWLHSTLSLHKAADLEIKISLCTTSELSSDRWIRANYLSERQHVQSKTQSQTIVEDTVRDNSHRHSCRDYSNRRSCRDYRHSLSLRQSWYSDIEPLT